MPIHSFSSLFCKLPVTPCIAPLQRWVKSNAHLLTAATPNRQSIRTAEVNYGWNGGCREICVLLNGERGFAVGGFVIVWKEEGELVSFIVFLTWIGHIRWRKLLTWWWWWRRLAFIRPERNNSLRLGVLRLQKDMWVRYGLEDIKLNGGVAAAAFAMIFWQLDVRKL